MIGMSARFLIWPASSSPSIPGIMRSRRTRSGQAASSRRSASAPERAIVAPRTRARRRRSPSTPTRRTSSSTSRIDAVARRLSRLRPLGGRGVGSGFAPRHCRCRCPPGCRCRSRCPCSCHAADLACARASSADDRPGGVGLGVAVVVRPGGWSLATGEPGPGLAGGAVAVGSTGVPDARRPPPRGPGPGSGGRARRARQACGGHRRTAPARSVPRPRSRRLQGWSNRRPAPGRGRGTT